VDGPECIALRQPFPQAHPFDPKELADVPQTLANDVAFAPGLLEEDRRKNARGEALEAKRAIELFLGMHVREGMTEDLGDAPHIGEQRVRPRPFAANRPEAQSTE
jgi:hypothetical protein